MIKFLVIGIVVIVANPAMAAEFLSAAEIEGNWLQLQKDVRVDANRMGAAPMDFSVVAQLNIDSAQVWEKLEQCNRGDSESSKRAYLERNFRYCASQEITQDLLRLHEGIRQFALTSEVRREENLPAMSERLGRLIHPLFVQILLEEAAKYTVVAVNEAPNKPKKIGICTGFISIGFCDYRQGEPRKPEISREEKNILESFRYLISDSCNLGLDTQSGYQVLIGIMNGFGVNISNGNYVTIRHGNGVFFSPKSWAADGAFVMRGSYAEISYRLQENVRKNCPVSDRNNDAGALDRYSDLAKLYGR
jgi:hypothetical protein